MAPALLIAALLAAPDGGADAPLWQLESAGTVLQTDAAVTTPANAQAFDVGLRTCESDRDGFKAELATGSGVSAKWAIIGVAIGFAGGMLATGLAVAGVALAAKK